MFAIRRIGWPSLEHAVAYCSPGSGHVGGENRERARLARLYLRRVIGAVGEQAIAELGAQEACAASDQDAPSS